MNENLNEELLINSSDELVIGEEYNIKTYTYLSGYDYITVRGNTIRRYGGIYKLNRIDNVYGLITYTFVNDYILK